MSDEGPRWPDVLVWYGKATAPGSRITLDADETHHLTRVLRAGPGDVVTLADGVGGWIEAECVTTRGRAELLVRTVRPAPTEPSRRLELAFPLLRPSRTEWLLEKATELGVTHLVPVRTERGNARGEKPERWQRVLRSATMQCLRSRPPTLTGVVPLLDWASSLEAGLSRWLATPGGARDPGPVAGGAALVVGPEGDLTGEEIEGLGRRGFQPVDLGPRRLRAETAAVALVSEVARRQRDP